MKMFAALFATVLIAAACGTEIEPVSPQEVAASSAASSSTGDAPTQEDEPSTPVSMLEGLTVATEYSQDYDRDLFKHWIDADGDGCDTRKEVLLVEAVQAPSVGSDCSLSDGDWISRYDGDVAEGTGQTFDVDHLVPLAEAWASGAYGWPDSRRTEYANDLDYVDSLIAVSASSNRSKGAKDPASWMPPAAEQHCWYASAWVHVKDRWSLTIDQDEKDFLLALLSRCSEDDYAIGMPAPVINQVPTTTPSTEPDVGPSECHPAYTPCLPKLSGDALNCDDLTSSQKPVTVNVPGDDPYSLDGDGDGTGCTS